MEDVKGTAKAIAYQRQLTYLAQYTVVAWQISYEVKDEFSMVLFARVLMMVEQIILDQGRC